MLAEGTDSSNGATKTAKVTKGESLDIDRESGAPREARPPIGVTSEQLAKPFKSFFPGPHFLVNRRRKTRDLRCSPLPTLLRS